MNILQVISSFPPAYSYGGPVKSSYDVSRELVQRGHNVTVFTTDTFYSKVRCSFKENPMWINGIKIYRYKNVSNTLAHKNLPFAPKMLLSLSKGLKQFDLIHLHEYRTLQAVAVHHYAKEHKVPYILQPRGQLAIVGKEKQKAVFDTIFGNRIVRDATKIIFSSRVEADSSYERFTDLKNTTKCCYIPNALELDCYQNLPKFGNFRRRYSINNEQKLILFLGRVHQIKGIDTLLKAFSILQEKSNQMKLVVAGPDEGFLYTAKQIAHH